MTLVPLSQVTDKALAELVLACPKLLPDNIEGCDHAKGIEFVQAVAQVHTTLEQLDLQGCPDVNDASLAIIGASCPQMHPDRLLCNKKGDAYLAAIAKVLPNLDRINLSDCDAVTPAGWSFLLTH